MVCCQYLRWLCNVVYKHCGSSRLDTCLALTLTLSFSGSEILLWTGFFLPKWKNCFTHAYAVAQYLHVLQDSKQYCLEYSCIVNKSIYSAWWRIPIYVFKCSSIINNKSICIVITGSFKALEWNRVMCWKEKCNNFQLLLFGIPYTQ